MAEITGHVEVFVEDAAGNRSGVAMFEILIDKTPPLIAYYIADRANAYAPVVITVLAEDDASGLAGIMLPSGELVEQYYAQYTVAQNGSFPFKAVDRAGNVAELVVIVDSIRQRPAPPTQACMTSTSRSAASATGSVLGLSAAARARVRPARLVSATNRLAVCPANCRCLRSPGLSRTACRKLKAARALTFRCSNLHTCRTGRERKRRTANRRTLRAAPSPASSERCAAFMPMFSCSAAYTLPCAYIHALALSVLPILRTSPGFFGGGCAASLSRAAPNSASAFSMRSLDLFMLLANLARCGKGNLFEPLFLHCPKIRFVQILCGLEKRKFRL